MIYIIISNVGLALMMLFVYIRYSKFRVTSTLEIKKLNAQVEKERTGGKALQDQLSNKTEEDHGKIEVLLREIDELRKEKENEVKLRLDAEKQVEVTLQKIEEVQRRMEDWQNIQDSVMQDSKDAIVKLGNDLYKKLSDNYKKETEASKNFMGRVHKEIEGFLDKFATIKVSGNTSEVNNEKQLSNKKDAATGSKTSAVKKVEPSGTHPSDEETKKLILDLMETMKASGHLSNKNYFLPANFDEKKAKLMLCEVGFLSSNTLNMIDFKACRYMAEYNKNSDKEQAEEVLKKRLDKYLAYLGNEKYRQSIKKLVSTNANFDKDEIIVVMPKSEEVKILKDNGYLNKMENMKIKVMDFDEVTNLVI